MTSKKKDIFLYESFLDRIDKPSTLNSIVLNILNKDLPKDIVNKFLLWFHNKCISDSKYTKALDRELIDKIYSQLEKESIVKLLESIDTSKNPSIIECSICKDHIENPHCFECGHIFCLECINKHKRSISIIRSNNYNCPTCRKIIINDPIKIFL
tara:strand:- start:352 stop:816 length:465 start_codon:yes stop_codon:yes gene_type:complete